MSVSRYIVRNSAVRIFSFAIGICFTFVVTPIIVHSIGIQHFGVWALIGSTIANYLLLDFGILQAVSKFVAAARVRGDQNEINQICSSALALNIISCIFSFIITFVLLVFSRDFIPSDVDSSEAMLSFAIFGTLFSIHFLFRTWSGVLASDMRWTRLAIIGTIKNILVSIVTIVCITEERGLLILAVINGFGFIFEGFFYYYFARKSSSIQIKFYYMNFGMCVNLLKYGTISLFAQIGQSMRFRSQPYILVNSIGAGGVAVFSIVTQFIAHFNSLILSAFGVFIPWFSRLQARGDSDGIRNSLIDATWLSFRVSSYVGLCLVFYGPDFVALWLGPDFNDVRLALIPMALGATFSTSMLPVQEYLMGVSKHKVSAICNLGEGVCVVLFSLASAPLWGMAGVGWSFFLCSFIFRGCLMPYFAFKQASIPIIKYLNLIGIAILTHVLPQYFFWIFINDFFTINYFSLFILVILQGSVAFIFQYLIFRFDRRFVGLRSH